MVLITPLPKTNLLYREKQKAFKCLVILYKMFNIVYGLHFGFTKFNMFKINISPKIVVIIQCTFYSALVGTFIIHSTSPLDSIIWFITFFLQYSLCTLLLTFIKEDSTFCKLLHDLQTIDIGLKVNSASYNLEAKLLLSIFTCLLIRISLSLLHCMLFKLCDSLSWSLTLYLFIFFGVDVVLLTCAFMFYAINCRLEKLESLVMAESSNFLSMQHLYKSIVDLAEKHKAGFSPLVSSTYITIMDVEPKFDHTRAVITKQYPCLVCPYIWVCYFMSLATIELYNNNCFSSSFCCCLIYLKLWLPFIYWHKLYVTTNR